MHSVPPSGSGALFHFVILSVAGLQLAGGVEGPAVPSLKPIFAN
jgi:hypothetical protein